MKKLLMILIMVGMALGLSGVTFAAPPFAQKTIQSTVNAGPDFNSGFSTLFSQDTYIFSVVDAIGDDGWLYDYNNAQTSWQWSLYIYQPSDSTNHPNGQLLGSTAIFPTHVAALQNNASSTVTIDVTNPSGEVLYFYMMDNDSPFGLAPTANNFGAVTFQVAVVPEPISSILFLTGGVVLVGRKYLKKRKA